MENIKKIINQIRNGQLNLSCLSTKKKSVVTNLEPEEKANVFYNTFFDQIIKNTLALEKNSEDMAAVSEHQTLRLTLANTFKSISKKDMRSLAKNFSYHLKQFTAPLHKDIPLLTPEYSFKKIHHAFFKDTTNEQDFCVNLLIATLYYLPWELNIQSIFVRFSYFMTDKNNEMTVDTLTLFLGYLFNLMTNYIEPEEANKHAVCIETALAEMIILLKSNIRDQDKKKILNIFKETYSGSLPLCNNLSLKELTHHSRVLATWATETDKNRLLPLHTCSEKHPKKIRLGLLRYETSQEIKVFADIYPLLNPDLFEIHLFTLTANLNNEATPVPVDFSSYKNFYLYDINHDDPIAAINQIRKKEIDILITASCLTGSVFWPPANLPIIFTHRAAPIQFLHISDVITSGIDNIDYIFTEKTHSDKQEPAHFTENIIAVSDAVRTFSIIQYEHLDKTEVRKKMGLDSNGIVFFSNAHLFKLSPELLKTWITILQNTSNSYLYLMPFSQPYMQWFLRRFKKCLKIICNEMHVDVERIIISMETSKTAMGNALQASDIYLDAFPYSGHTSTNEALCAALPVVTLSQKTLRSNLTANLLQILNLENFITHSETDYINLASRFVTDKALRDTFVNTAQQNLPLLNQPKAVAKALEEVFIALHHKHAKQGKTKQPFDLLTA